MEIWLGRALLFSGRSGWVITVIQANPFHNARIGACISVAPKLSRVKNRECLLYFLRSLRLFFPNAMSIL
jgi:hypothetical protein